MRTSLDGRRGWTTVVTLAAALLCIVTGQLYAMDAASASSAAPSAAAYAGAGSAYDRPTAASVATRLAAAQRAADEAVRQAAEVTEQATAQTSAPAAPAQAPESTAPSVVPAVATAPADDLCSGPGWQQRRGEAALAALGPRASGSGFRVEFAPARSGYMGLAHLQRRVVEIFVRDCGDQSDALLRHVIAHELGHAFDTVRMSDASREAWKAARGIPASVPWYGCSGCADFATPAGDFAEVYAQWLRGAGDNRSQIAGAPGGAQLQALADQFFAA